MTPRSLISSTLRSQGSEAVLAGNAYLEDQSALRQRICGIAAAVIEGAVGKGLRALILTGSLARDEAGFDIRDGRCKVRGDSEFLVVLKDRAPNIPPNQRQFIIEVLRTQLLRAGIDCYVSLGFVKGQYLANIRPHIFGYELRVCGVVVTGEPDTLSLIPEFAPHEIPLEDGWRLLANRIVEFIGYAHEWITGPEAVSAEARYRMVKLYLDMATSFLLFESAYEPTYSGRAEKLRGMTQSPDGNAQDPPFLLRDFSSLVSLCTRYKVGNFQPDGEVEFLWKQIGTRDSLNAAVNLAHSLWRWELSKLADLDSRLNDRQLMGQWMKLQPISRRLPGWGYVLRHSGWHRSWKNWPRWASSACKASPRYCIYSVASELFFSLPTFSVDSEGIREPSVDLRKTRSLLILKGKSSTRSPVTLQQICSEIVSNYREFLEGTRA